MLLPCGGEICEGAGGGDGGGEAEAEKAFSVTVTHVRGRNEHIQSYDAQSLSQYSFELKHFWGAINLNEIYTRVHWPYVQ